MLKNDKAKAWAAFACVAFFWGTTYAAISFGVKSFPPLLFAGLRHLTAGCLILIYFIIRKYPFPPKDQIKHIVIMGLLMLGIGNGLLVWSQQYLPSGLAAIISSTFPFAVFLFSWAKGNEKLNMNVVAGIVLGFVGQVFIFYDRIGDLSNRNFVWGMVGLFAAVIVWGYGAVYRKTAKITIHSLYFSGLQMVFAGLLFLPVAAIKGEFALLPYVQPEAIWVFLYLVVFGSIIAYGSFMYVLQKLPATMASMYSHINTIVAVILGWLLLNEVLNINIVFSVILTLTGVYLVNKGLSD